MKTCFDRGKGNAHKRITIFTSSQAKRNTADVWTVAQPKTKRLTSSLACPTNATQGKGKPEHTTFTVFQLG